MIITICGHFLNALYLCIRIEFVSQSNNDYITDIVTY